MTDPRKESSIERCRRSRICQLARCGDRIVVMGVGDDSGARDDSLSQFARELLRRVAGT
jgi:hypothetical protein